MQVTITERKVKIALALASVVLGAYVVTFLLAVSPLISRVVGPVMGW